MVRTTTLIDRLIETVPAARKLQRPELTDLAQAVQVLSLERPPPDQLWTLPAMAQYLEVDLRTMRRLAKSKDFPLPVDAEWGGQVWKARDLYTWLDGTGRSQLRLVKG